MSFDFNTPHKKRQEIAQNIFGSYKEEPIAKAVENEFEKGGKKAVIGEKRTFGGREYIKTQDGWKFHGKGTGSKAQEHAKNSLDHHVDTNKTLSDKEITDKIRQYGESGKMPSEEELKSLASRSVYKNKPENLKEAIQTSIDAHQQEKDKSKTKTPRSKNATDHLVEEDGKHFIDVLDPDSGAKKFKPGDKVHYHDDNGKKHSGIISDREHPDGDMYEVDREGDSKEDLQKQLKAAQQKPLFQQDKAKVKELKDKIAKLDSQEKIKVPQLTLNNFKEHMIAKYKNKGELWENFGQEELMRLEEKLGEKSDPYGTKEQRSIHNKLQQLSDWAMNYTG